MKNGKTCGGLLSMECAWIGTGLVMFLGGCSMRHGLTEQDRRRIVEVLTLQDAAWNDGDLETFMAAYWQSPELTFSSGGKVTRGWQPTLDYYRRRYPSRDAMGVLTFSDLEISDLGPNHALVLGRWYLKREVPAAGAFTLVLRRQKDRWVIVHDHTSKDAA